MMYVDDRLVYTEIYELLNILGNEYIKKIPQNLYAFFANNRLKEYNKEEIKNNIYKHDIQKKTLALYAFLNNKYFIESDLIKRLQNKIYSQNIKDVKAKNIIQINKLFDDNINKKKEESSQLICIKEDSFLKKIIKKLKDFFAF